MDSDRVKAINKKLKGYRMTIRKIRGQELYYFVKPDFNCVWSAYGDKLTLNQVEELVNDKTIFEN